MIAHSLPNEYVLDFQYLAPFRNEDDSNANEVENRGQISHFFTPCKIYGIGERNVWSTTFLKFSLGPTADILLSGPFS